MDIRRCFNGEGKAVINRKPRTHSHSKISKFQVHLFFIPQTFKQKYARKKRSKNGLKKKNKDLKNRLVWCIWNTQCIYYPVVKQMQDDVFSYLKAYNYS